MLQMTLLVLQLLLVALWPLVVAMGRMEVLYSWKQIDLDFPTSALRDEYISSGQFIPKNNVILDVDVWNGEFNNIKSNNTCNNKEEYNTIIVYVCLFYLGFLPSQSIMHYIT